MEELIQAVSTVGFPIITFLLVFWKFDKSLGLLTQAVDNFMIVKRNDICRLSLVRSF